MMEDESRFLRVAAARAPRARKKRNSTSSLLFSLSFSLSLSLSLFSEKTPILEGKSENVLENCRTHLLLWGFLLPRHSRDRKFPLYFFFFFSWCVYNAISTLSLLSLFLLLK